MRRRLPDIEREEETGPRPVVTAAPAPQLARILALQQSAGNQAVSRVLARLTDEDVTSKGDRKTLGELKTKYNTNFGDSGLYKTWPNREEWHYYFEKAYSLKNLGELLDADIVKAKSYAALPQPVATQEEEKKPTKPLPNANQSKAPQQAQQQTPKQPKYTPVDMSKIQAANPWDMHQPEAIHTADPNPTMPQQVMPPTHAVFDLSEYTNPITSWNRTTHGGKRGQSLSLTNARAIVNWLDTSFPNRNAVYVCRGPGSGGYSSQTQLKIIHRVNNVGTKKATYHLSLAKSVYDQLVEVEFAGADWGDTS